MQEPRKGEILPYCFSPQPSFAVVRMEEVNTPNQRCEKGKEEAEQGHGRQVVSGDDRMQRKEEKIKEKQQLQGTGNYFYLIAASLL